MIEKSFMFFLSTRQENYKIIMGDGNDKDHFRICVSSFRLLLKYDVKIQNNDTMHGVNGTYHIFTEKFTL